MGANNKLKKINVHTESYRYFSSWGTFKHGPIVLLTATIVARGMGRSPGSLVQMTTEFHPLQT